MINYRKKISCFVLELQSQSEVPLWSLASEILVYAAALGEKPAWGPRSSCFRRFMVVANKLKLADILICVIGFFSVIRIWLQVKKTRLVLEKEVSPFKSVFAGFGASPEEYLYRDYLERAQQKVLRINWVTQAGLGGLPKPSLFSLCSLLIRTAFGHCSNLTKLASVISEIGVYKDDFLMICAFNIGQYVFYREYWKQAKLAGIEEVAFLAPANPMFACVDAGLKTVFLQHGLVGLSIVVPEVQKIIVLTQDELCYFKSSFKNTEVCLRDSFIKIDGSKRKVIMILSVNTFLQERLRTIESIVQWAKIVGLQVLIRPTPCVTPSELATIQTHLPDVWLDDITKPFSESLLQWSPQFVAAWTSTSLADALSYGILPISFFDPVKNDALWNMVYPFKQRVLFWPRDKLVINSSFLSEEHYASEVLRLRNAPDELCRELPENGFVS